jgi:hypothetical protein
MVGKEGEVEIEEEEGREEEKVKEEKGKKEGLEVSEILREQEHVLKIFEQLLRYVEEENALKIKELSNLTIHSASLYQDEDSILIAIVTYALSKIFERKKYREYPDWPNFLAIIKKDLKQCYQAAKEKDIDNFRASINNIVKNVERLSGHLREYVKQIFRKARINKGSRIYEHGISFQQTAEILGISVWELAEYIGQTGIANVEITITKPVAERIKIARKLFE